MYKLPFDEWEATYQPMTNAITNDSDKYETYGDELEYILQQDDRHVWTEMDSGEGISIVSGYHLVNRINYYITNKPWTDDIEVPVCVDKECECVEADGEGNEDCYTCGGTFYETIWINTREEMEEIYGTK